MPFWTYMLQCGDRFFYVGHTNNLEQRMGEHHAGTFRGYTSTRHPLHLVWSEEFSTRVEALEAERRLKGWGRAKKLALIRGDWALISALSRNRQQGEGRASTGSARTGWKALLHAGYLHPHPHRLPSEPFSLEVRLSRRRGIVRAGFALTGPISQLLIQSPNPPARRDNLWQHTCFELFAQTGAGYLEFNLSPSTEWAAYRFSGYREGMAELDVAAPRITVWRSEQRLELNAELELAEDVSRLGLSAVVEELDGAKSYWALRHPPGDKPDFHHPDCFALEVPPASGS